jgi:hypothetical protein
VQSSWKLADPGISGAQQNPLNLQVGYENNIIMSEILHGRDYARPKRRRL